MLQSWFDEMNSFVLNSWFYICIIYNYVYLYMHFGTCTGQPERRPASLSAGSMRRPASSMRGQQLAPAM
jgi:hypothetical protein